MAERTTGTIIDQSKLITNHRLRQIHTIQLILATKCKPNGANTWRLTVMACYRQFSKKGTGLSYFYVTNSPPLMKWCGHASVVHIRVNISPHIYNTNSFILSGTKQKAKGVKSVKLKLKSSVCWSSFVNIFVDFGENIFQQVIGIHMWTNCAPLISNLFIYSHE